MPKKKTTKYPPTIPPPVELAKRKFHEAYLPDQNYLGSCTVMVRGPRLLVDLRQATDISAYPPEWEGFPVSYRTEFQPEQQNLPRFQEDAYGPEAFVGELDPLPG